MRLNEISFSGPPPIDGYGPGFFRVAGEVVEGAILAGPEGVHAWKGLADMDALEALAGEVDVLLIGTGTGMERPSPELVERLESLGMGVEAMATPAACRTYNVLLAEGRRVAAALVPV